MSTTFLYVLGDPYSRFEVSKVGIADSLHRRIDWVFSSCPRRCQLLPEGVGLFSSYMFRNRSAAIRVESAILGYFKRSMTDRDTQGWFLLKPAIVDLSVDILAEREGLEMPARNYDNYARWAI